MPSSSTSPSRCRSSTDSRVRSRTRRALIAALSIAAAIAFATGCSDDGSGGTCGTDDAPTAGLVVTGTDLAVTYGNLSSLSGNDCPDPAAPEGVISLSIEGQAIGGTGLITFCIPRPDLLRSGTRALGNTAMGDVRVIDLQGANASCTYRSRSTLPMPTGTVTATGVCDNGTNPAGFAMAIDGALMVERTCGASVDQIPVTLVGRVAVTSRD